MEFFRSIYIYSRGILKRIYWVLLFFLFSNPFNVAERWFGVRYEAPSYLVWVLLFIGFCFASFFTFHSLRKSIVKKVRATASEGSAENAAAELNKAKSIIDKAAQKGVLHKKNAARKISRLSKLVNSI